MTSPVLVPPSSIDLTEGNSENSDIIRLSKKFEHETSLFLQYIAEIKVKDFTLNKKACIQGFISKLQGCHMELLYKVIETHSLVEMKNSEIIGLQKELYMLRSGLGADRSLEGQMAFHLDFLKLMPKY